MAHISGPEQQLGLEVDPAEVRLVPGPTDPYGWQYGPEQEHLFRKQLSKHHVSAYRQICQHLGRSIRAVCRDGQFSRSPSMQDMGPPGCSVLPFTASSKSLSSRGCCQGAPGLTVEEVGEGLLVTMNLPGSAHHPPERMIALQELEAANRGLAARLEAAMSVAEERNTEIQRLQESKDVMEQRLHELQATLQLRNTEALRRTQLVAEHKEKEKALAALLQGWERGLRTLQVEVGTALQHQTSISIA